MTIVGRVVLVLTLVFVGSAAYLWRYGNLGIPTYDGCSGARGLPSETGTVHFKVFPPHYVCRYRTKTGRVVELSE